MSQGAAASSTLDPQLLPGGAIIVRIRRLLVLALAAASAYSVFTRGTKGICPGGFDGNGGFLDADGNATEIAPSCVQLTLGPSPLVLIAAALLVIGALTRVLRRAENVEAAIRTLDRTATIIVGVLVASCAIAVVWFALIPIADASESWSAVYPFPFGSVEMTIAPAPAG